MTEFEKIKTLSTKIENLLHAVEHSGGRFTVIDKDMLSAYVRDLYELVVAINTFSKSENATDHGVIERINEEMPVRPEVNQTEKVIVESPAAETIVSSDEKKNKIDSPKRSIAELYSGKTENEKTVNDKFKKAGTEVADRLRQVPIADLKAYIGLNKRFAFINRLFNGDEMEYEAAIAKVNAFKSYEEAANYIQTAVLQNFKWNDDEPLVAEFFTLVMRRYLN